jgi:hypothetical protein
MISVSNKTRELLVMQVWIKESSYKLFCEGFIIECVKDSYNGSLNKQCMKKINISLSEIEDENDSTVWIRKKY